MAVFLIIVGLLMVLWGYILFIMEAFRESILWGLGCLLFQPIQFVFLLLHADVAGKPFMIQIGGFVLVIVGMFMGAGS